MPNTFQLFFPGLQVVDEQVQLIPVQMSALIQQEEKMLNAPRDRVAGKALPGQEVIYQIASPQRNASVFVLLPVSERSPIFFSHQHEGILQRHMTIY